MPLSQAKPDALCQVYARSLFELAEKQGGRAKAEECLSELTDIVELAREDKQFSEFVSSRLLGATARAAALDRIFKGRVSDLTLRFLHVLNTKARLPFLAMITDAYDALSQDRYGRVEVDVYTAEPLPPGGTDPIRDRLAATLGKEVVVHPFVDAHMIGGIKIQLGDQLIDGSIATRLRKLRDSLATQGIERLRGRMDQIFGG